MTQSCFLGWFKSCYTTDFSSQGRSHSVTLLPLHHSRMAFTKRLHVLVCVCLGIFSHPNVLQRAPHFTCYPRQENSKQSGQGLHNLTPPLLTEPVLSKRRTWPAVPDMQHFSGLKSNQRAKLQLGTALPVESGRSCLSKHHSEKVHSLLEPLQLIHSPIIAQWQSSQIRHAENWDFQFSVTCLSHL